MDGMTDDPTYLTMGYALIALGFLLLVAELFIPTHGTLFVVAVACLALGVALTFFYNRTIGAWTLVGVFVVLPLFGRILLTVWPRTPVGRRMMLIARTEEDNTLASLEANQELELLRGRFGRAVSPLRPSGLVDFEGRRVQTITEGRMVEPGQWVRCVAVQAGKVIVRPVEKPNLEDLEAADFG
jgi:membrane-bound ClpP family serine protease